ncbi:secreted protein containing PKD domain protein [Nonlabens sp. MIC269]|uniref:T9SS type B sorting domain-containing protein n=1 Tax=Nonlabens sp. MIC269 TaxID=1476901 RepID=UPI00071F1691|nr:T9SS type B sorting domain-containing protein [Nonlabens sp. MIC269]ALM20203.1 secreted protein containing PKD domain protein [Nonlabens sp. MIC269]
MKLKNIYSAFFIVLFLFINTSVYAQLEASNWYFGFNAGLRFDPVSNTVTPLVNGQLSTNEGCASISDAQGNLLFYTDGITVYDRNHGVMQNGNGLLGDPSSTQSAIIIPKPQDSDIYYIFTVDTQVGSDANTGFHWYEVDMSLNLGQGAVTTNLNTPNNLLRRTSEKLTAINHATNDEIFIIVYANQNGASGNFNTFYTYKVTPTGVDPVPVRSTFTTSVTDPRGNIKVSPDGQYLVSCNMVGGTYIYDFDQTTGTLSNERRFNFASSDNLGYGVEFSPDSSLLYISTLNNASGNNPTAYSTSLFQYDLNAPNIPGSEILLDTRQGYRNSMQLGIDGKIYRTTSDTYDNGRPFLSVINNPNVRGTGCNFVADAIALSGRLSTQGLPPFIQSFFALIDVENTCLGDTTEFTFETDNLPDSVLWDFGDGNTSSQTIGTNVYTTPGVYQVTLTLTTGGASRTYRKTVEIFDSPTANNVVDQDICDLDNNGNETLDLDTDVTPIILGTQDATTFNVRYFTSQQNAIDNVNELSSPYTVNASSETIYVRIYNRNNTECFDTTSFDVNIFQQPVIQAVQDIEVCDDDFDGIQQFDLTSINSLILGNQSSTDFEITFHTSQGDADLGSNPISSPYTNNTPFLETVYVRLENRNNSTCADTSQSFNLIVQDKPEAIDFDAFQCDEDGIPDGRTTFSFDSFSDAISNNANDVTVSYHSTQSNADSNTNPLDTTSYTNTTPAEIVYARVTNDVTGCYSTSQVTLRVSASDAQDTTLQACDDLSNDGIADFTLTLADSDVLTNAPADVTVNYYETTDDALTEQNPLTSPFTNTTPFSQTIFARAESPDGNCYGISEVELIVNALPNIEPQALFEYCGNDPQPLSIDAGLISGNPDDFTYSWSNGETTNEILVSTGGDYTVTVTNAEGCSSQRIVTVVISEPATIDNLIINHAGTNSSGSMEVVASGLGDYEYSIDILTPYQDSPIFTDIEPGFYTLYVRDKNGCGVTRKDFSIVGYPRFFTPNGDSFNDYWQLIGVNTVFEPNSTIFIYDRFGKLLKQISPESVGWDGTFNGNPLPSSDYWFTATLMDGTQFSSHFSLKR